MGRTGGLPPGCRTLNDGQEGRHSEERSGEAIPACQLEVASNVMREGVTDYSSPSALVRRLWSWVLAPAIDVQVIARYGNLS